MPPSVVWFEVVGKDGDRLRRFFSSLFGWKIADSGTGMDYGLVAAANGGIGGGGEARWQDRRATDRNSIGEPDLRLLHGP